MPIFTSHNGGRTQAGLGPMQGGSLWPPLNLMKQSSNWALVGSGNTPDPSFLDSNGYPTTLEGSGIVANFHCPRGSRSGNYKVRWIGNGRLNITGLGSTGFATDGDIGPFDPGSHQIALQITGIGGSPITHIEFFHEDDEALIDAGQVFSQAVLDEFAYAGWGTTRFMDWQLNNLSDISRWRHMKPYGYAYWHGYAPMSEFYAGATTGVADAYVIADEPPDWEPTVGGKPADGQLIVVKFHASGATDTPTINVADTGAIPIGIHSGQVPLVNSTRYPVAGRYACLVYNAGMDVWAKIGGDGNDFNYYVNNGVPVEAMLQFCLETGTHPWVCPPKYACDPGSNADGDWMRGMANFWKDNAPSWMIPRYEVTPNELWNGALGFQPTPWCRLRAAERWSVDSTLASTMNNWAGMSASVNGQVLDEVYESDRDRYQAILGLATYASNPSASVPRMESTLYVAEGGGNTPASDWITHVGCSNYFRDTYTGSYLTGDLYQLGVDYDAAVTEEEIAAVVDPFVLSAYEDPVGDFFGVPSFLAAVEAYKTWAESYDVDGFAFYEGGWSPDYAPSAIAVSNATDRAFQASRYSDELFGVLEHSYYATMDLGCDPSHYYVAGTGVWAIYEDIYVEPFSVQRDVCNKINVLKRRRYRMEPA
jgi:hypothetical protein